MSEEYEFETTEDGKKKKKIADEVIELRHTYEKPVATNKSDLESQLVAEKKRREELELIVEVEATKHFEDEKNAFLNLIPDEEKRNEIAEKIGDDPQVLQEYQRMASFLASALKGSGVKITGLPEEDEEDSYTPSGRATLPQGNQGVAENYKEYVNELYEILKDPEKSVKERKIADQKINDLFAQMVLGIKARGSRNQDMPYLPPTASCPNCGAQLIGDLESCPHCGWRLYAKNFTPRGR